MRARGRACTSVSPVDVSLAAVAHQEAHRPRVAREAAADRLRAVAREELRHLLRVQVVADREVVGGADAREDREDLVLLDEPPRQLHGLRGVVGVVVGRYVIFRPWTPPRAFTWSK